MLTCGGSALILRYGHYGRVCKSEEYSFGSRMATCRAQAALKLISLGCHAASLRAGFCFSAAAAYHVALLG